MGTPPTSLTDTHLTTARRAVEALPLDWRDLEQHLPPALGVWGDGTPRGGGNHPIPLNTTVEALQHAIWWITTAWEEVLRDHHHLSDPPKRRPGPPMRRWVVDRDGQTSRRDYDSRAEHPSALARPMRPGPADVVRACGIISPRLHVLAALPTAVMADYPIEAVTPSTDPPDPRRVDDTRVWRGMRYTMVTGAQAVTDLVALHHRAVAALGLTQPTRHVPGECSGCGRADLRQDQPRYRGDDPLVYCGGCERTWTYAEYERYVGLWEAAA